MELNSVQYFLSTALGLRVKPLLSTRSPWARTATSRRGLDRRPQIVGGTASQTRARRASTIAENHPSRKVLLRLRTSAQAALEPIEKIVDMVSRLEVFRVVCKLGAASRCVTCHRHKFRLFSSKFHHYLDHRLHKRELPELVMPAWSSRD